jgi:hypothetical protein
MNTHGRACVCMLASAPHGPLVRFGRAALPRSALGARLCAAMNGACTLHVPCRVSHSGTVHVAWASHIVVGVARSVLVLRAVVRRARRKQRRDLIPLPVEPVHQEHAEQGLDAQAGAPRHFRHAAIAPPHTRARARAHTHTHPHTHTHTHTHTRNEHAPECRTKRGIFIPDAAVSACVPALISLHSDWPPLHAAAFP